MQCLLDQVSVAGERRSSSGSIWMAQAEFEAALAALRVDHGDDSDEEVPANDVRDRFDLHGVEAALLWAAAAVDLDANIGRVYAALRGAAASVGLSVALAFELVGIGTASAEAFEVLGPNASLRRHRLVEVTGIEPWLHRRVSVPDTVLAVLAGACADDPTVSRLRMDVVVPLDLPGGAQIARGVAQGVPLVWIRSPFGAAGVSLGAGALAAAGRTCLAIDARAHLPGQVLADVLAVATREAGLSGSALLVAGAEVLADADDRRAFEVLAQAVVPVIAVGSRSWNPAWLPRIPLLVDAEPLNVEQRAALWTAELGGLTDEDDDLRRTLLGLRLSPEAATETVRYGQLIADSQGTPLTGLIVREAARRVGGSSGSAADHISAPLTTVAGPRFADLVLPDESSASLRRLVSWAQHRDEVAALGALRGHGRGIAALFAGGPGTGKTLAAHVVAEELSMNLFQVDLATVVDKYIGETEKNLEKVFQAAEALDVVLFFDEADALFGSRSEVRDSRDRYANQEVAYLLQRMEHFDGITILATNLRGNLDKAFSRRMSFIVDFSDPDPPQRRRLWVQHLARLPCTDPADPVQLDFLAESVDLTGGDIRNIVLGAAYEATSAGSRVGMQHLVGATLREYGKLGRLVPAHGFIPVRSGWDV